MPRVSRDFEIRLEHLLRRLGARQWPGGCGAAGGTLGQQRHCGVGVPGDVLKARREGREFGALGRAKCKVCEVVEESA